MNEFNSVDTVPLVSAEIVGQPPFVEWSYFSEAVPPSGEAPDFHSALSHLLAQHLSDHPDWRLSIVLSPVAVASLSSSAFVS